MKVCRKRQKVTSNFFEKNFSIPELNVSLDSESSNSECDDLLKKFVIPKSEEIEMLIFKDRSKTSMTKIFNEVSQVQKPISLEASFFNVTGAK